eukprot:1160525-Pelagomonas_calceolata.AAC.14
MSLSSGALKCSSFSPCSQVWDSQDVCSASRQSHRSRVNSAKCDKKYHDDLLDRAEGKERNGKICPCSHHAYAAGTAPYRGLAQLTA